jgi:hypothetical protein
LLRLPTNSELATSNSKSNSSNLEFYVSNAFAKSLKNNKFEITEMHSESGLNALSNAPNEFETFDSNICVDTMLQKRNVCYAS